jgi:hypothetical protein
MNARVLAAAALASAAALRAAPAAAQTDTAAVTVTVGKTAEPATPRTDAPTPTMPRVRRSLNTITWEEVRAARVSDAYQLVHNLRPSWLRTPRGPSSIRNNIDLAVFLNGVRMGTRDALANIPINSVRTLRFYTATEARLKFGGDTSAGAIEVLSQ